MEGVQGGGGQNLAWGFAEPQKPEEGRGRKCEGLSKEELISMLGLWTLKKFARTPLSAPVPLSLDFPAKTHTPSIPESNSDATDHSEGECTDKAWALANASNFPYISLESPSQVSTEGQPH